MGVMVSNVKGHKESLGLMAKFYILIQTVGTQWYTFVKLMELNVQNWGMLSYVNNTSIKLTTCLQKSKQIQAVCLRRQSL